MTDPVSNPKPLNTAVLFLIFNRPETTARVFEAIRSAKPTRLYVAADGARHGNNAEVDRVISARSIATAVDWPCELKTLFRRENLGCKRAVGEAISWFFDQEEQGIILEDDCLPHLDFFRFSEVLLKQYKDDTRVSVITGNNFQNGIIRGGASYYFSKYNHCWGWASWRRAWHYYEGGLAFWPEWSQSADWRKRMVDPVERRYWKQIFDRVHAGKIDTWDYSWTASVWHRGGLTATPNVNLVSNIGFGQDSTHTNLTSSHLSALPTGSIGDIRHADIVKHDVNADKYAFDRVFDGKYQRFPYRFVAGPLRLFRRLCKKLLIMR